MMCKLSVPFSLDCCHTGQKWMIWRWSFIRWRVIGWNLQEQLANDNGLDTVSVPLMAIQFHAIQYGLPQDYGRCSGGSTQQLLKRMKCIHCWLLKWGQCWFAGTPGHHWDQKQTIWNISSHSQSGSKWDLESTPRDTLLLSHNFPTSYQFSYKPDQQF